MDTFTISQSSNALKFLGEKDINRQADFQQYNCERDVDSSDDEAASACPVFDTLYKQGGSDSIKPMTKFNPCQFGLLWNSLCKRVARKYIVRRGKDKKYKKRCTLYFTYCSKAR